MRAEWLPQVQLCSSVTHWDFGPKDRAQNDVLGPAKRQRQRLSSHGRMTPPSPQPLQPPWPQRSPLKDLEIRNYTFLYSFLYILLHPFLLHLLHLILSFLCFLSFLSLSFLSFPLHFLRMVLERSFQVRRQKRETAGKQAKTWLLWDLSFVAFHYKGAESSIAVFLDVGVHHVCRVFQICILYNTVCIYIYILYV